jgi:hypothetical protein
MIASMTIDRAFYAFAAVLGLAIGAVLVFVPESRAIGFGPFFWVLIGIALFEAIAVYLRGFDKGPLEMQTRGYGFVIAMGLVIAIRIAAGIDSSIF